MVECARGFVVSLFDHKEIDFDVEIAINSEFTHKSVTRVSTAAIGLESPVGFNDIILLPSATIRFPL